MSSENDLRVGDWLVQPELNRVAGHGDAHQVEPKVMRVLLSLAARPGVVISRDELLAEVWPDTVVVESAVFRAISELRRIFEDDPKQPRVIDTVRKRGYRLIAPVTRLGTRDHWPDGTGTASPGDSIPNHPIPSLASERRRYWPRLAGLSILALALAATAAFRFRATDITVPTRAPSWPAPPNVITSSPELEFAPALSPDGRGVAFVRSAQESRRSDLWEICIKLPGDAEPRVLNPGPISECSPTWSPDGRTIAFWRYAKRHDELSVVPVLGGPPRVLARARRGSGRDTGWSPDGRWVVGSGRAVADGPKVILLAAASGDNEVRQLTQPPDGWYGDGAPAISPDGKTIAFVRSSVVGHEQDIYLLPTSGGEVRRLTFDRKPIRGLTWRSDSEHLVFSSKRSHQYALWQMSVATGELSWTGIADARSPNIAASPVVMTSLGTTPPGDPTRAGDLLVYEHTEREVNIWELDLGPGPPNSEASTFKSLIRSTRTDRSPHHRPDGTAIAFSSDRTGHFEIWMSDRAGAHSRQLTHFRQFANRPRWSPDSRRLAFQADLDGNHDIYIIDGIDQAPRRLTRAAATDQAPSWSPDGHWIFFASIRSGVWQVWKTASGGGQPVQVTRGGGFTAHATADGRWLYFTRSNAAGLWRKPIVGGDEEVVLERFRHWTFNAWTTLGHQILYARGSPGGGILAIFDPDTSSERILAPIPAETALEFSVSGDLESVLFTQIDRRASDIHQALLPPV